MKNVDLGMFELESLFVIEFQSFESANLINCWDTSVRLLLNFWLTLEILQLASYR